MVSPPKLEFFPSPLLSPNRHMMMVMIAAMAIAVVVIGSSGRRVVGGREQRSLAMNRAFPTPPRPQPASLRPSLPLFPCRQSPSARPTIALSARGPSIRITECFAKRPPSSVISRQLGKCSSVTLHTLLETCSNLGAHNLRRYQRTAFEGRAGRIPSFARVAVAAAGWRPLEAPQSVRRLRERE